MFAPKIAKATTKAPDSPTRKLAPQPSTLVARPLGGGAVEQARMLQGTIGNQATLRYLTHRLSNLPANSERHEQDAAPENMTVRGAPRGPSWNFSKVPIFPPGRADRSQPLSPLGATQQARQPYEKSQIRPAQDSDVAQVVLTPTIHEALQSPGQPLHLGTRAFMERRFGQDFSNVRIHADREAAECAAGFGARAFTLGDHISFGANELAPQTRSGRNLIAHELAHVAQNRSGNPSARTLEPTSSRGGGESSGLLGRDRPSNRAADSTPRRCGADPDERSCRSSIVLFGGRLGGDCGRRAPDPGAAPR